MVTDPGLYTLTLVFRNGCQRTADFVFDGDFTLPDVSGPPDDTLNCGEEIFFTLNSTTPGVSYSWRRPSGIVTSAQTIRAFLVGTFQGTVLAPNGCRAFDTVQLFRGNDLFDFETFSDTLDCFTNAVQIGVQPGIADEFKWIGHMGPDSTASSITVFTPGTYEVVLTDTNLDCSILTEIEVIGDFRAPAFSYALDTISCLHPVAELNFIPQPGENYFNIFWELPDLTTVQGPVLMSDFPGVHRLIGIGENGCQSVAAFEIPFDTLAPVVLTETGILNCEDTITLVAQSVDTNLVYNWSGPGIVQPGTDSIGVNRAGFYQLMATAENGCVTQVDVLADSNYVLPEISLDFDSIRCDRLATLEVNSTDTIIAYHWMGPGGLSVMDSIVQTGVPGLYIAELRGNNNCLAMDSVRLDPPVFPENEIMVDTLTCIVDTVTLMGSTSVSPAMFAWINSTGDTISMNANVDVGETGPFTLSVTGPNGCITSDMVVVPVDMTFPEAMIDLIGEIRCQQRDFQLDATSSQPANALYAWWNMGGQILSDTSSGLIDARDTGTYILEVINPFSRCRDTTSIVMTEHPDAITDAGLALMMPQCSGDRNGTIEVTSVTGGVDPLTYSLNGNLAQTTPFFDRLPAGNYDVIIRDAEGCVFDTMVVIEPTLPFTMDAGPDQEIYLGESAMLAGQTTIQVSNLAEAFWDSLGVQLCTDCPDLMVSPRETTQYIFEVRSTTGCILRDTMVVFVIERGKFFIANIFSPNGDQINDEIRFHGSPGIQRVRQWVIYDRWGNAVYGKTDFDPFDPSAFWDGRTSTGEFANPAVFVYLLEVELINGETELHHGSITLIR